MKKTLIVFSCFVSLMFCVLTSQSNSQEVVSKATISNAVVLPYENVDFPYISSDGKNILFIRYKDASLQDLGEIWRINYNGSGVKRLYGEDGVGLTSPICSPDNSKVMYFKNNNFELWQMNFDGSGQEPITEKKYEKFNAQYSPDGTKIYLGLLGIQPSGIYSLDLVSKTQKLIFSSATLGSLNPSFTLSPDGKTLLLVSGPDLYLLNLDGTLKEKRTIKKVLSGDEEPIWTPDGKYIILGNLLYVLATSEEVLFLPETALKYVEPNKPDLVGPHSMSLSKDGKKISFLMIESNSKTYRARIKIADLIWK